MYPLMGLAQAHISLLAVLFWAAALESQRPRLLRGGNIQSLQMIRKHKDLRLLALSLASLFGRRSCFLSRQRNGGRRRVNKLHPLRYGWM